MLLSWPTHASSDALFYTPDWAETIPKPNRREYGWVRLWTPSLPEYAAHEFDGLLNEM